jgi:hypothetical protein
MTVVSAAALLTGYGSSAWAQEQDDDDVEINIDADDDVAVKDTTDDYTYDEDEDDNGLMSGFGTSLQVGGGVFGFIDESTENFMDTGGSWTARLVLGTRMPLALEAAYIGTANDISALGLDDDAVLLGNGAEAALRWNIISTFLGSIDAGFGRIDPYVFGGIAYKHYNLINDDFNTSAVDDSDDVGEVPMGGGIAWNFGGFALDLRGEYRLSFSDNLVGGGDSDNNDNELDTWNASARLGMEF